MDLRQISFQGLEEVLVHYYLYCSLNCLAFNVIQMNLASIKVINFINNIFRLNLSFLIRSQKELEKITRQHQHKMSQLRLKPQETFKL